VFAKKIKGVRTFPLFKIFLARKYEEKMDRTRNGYKYANLSIKTHGKFRILPKIAKGIVNCIIAHNKELEGPPNPPVKRFPQA